MKRLETVLAVGTILPTLLVATARIAAAAPVDDGASPPPRMEWQRFAQAATPEELRRENGRKAAPGQPAGAAPQHPMAAPGAAPHVAPPPAAAHPAAPHPVAPEAPRPAAPAMTRPSAPPVVHPAAPPVVHPAAPAAPHPAAPAAPRPTAPVVTHPSAPPPVAPHPAAPAAKGPAGAPAVARPPQAEKPVPPAAAPTTVPAPQGAAPVGGPTAVPPAGHTAAPETKAPSAVPVAPAPVAPSAPGAARPPAAAGPGHPLSGPLPGQTAPAPAVGAPPAAGAVPPTAAPNHGPVQPVPGQPQLQGRPPVPGQPPVQGQPPRPPQGAGGVVPPPTNGPGVVPPPTNGPGVVPPPTNGPGVVPPPTNGPGVVPPPAGGPGVAPPAGDGRPLPPRSQGGPGTGALLGAAAAGAAVGIVGGMMLGGDAHALADVQRQRRETVEGGVTYYAEPGRVIVRDDRGLYLRHDETERFRDFGGSISDERDGDRTVRVWTRPDGVRIVTVTDPDGRLIRRVRRWPDGREEVLIDDGFRPRPNSYREEVVVLPPPPVPVERRWIDAERSDDTAIYDTLEAPPFAPLPRRYTLDEVRSSRDLRAYMGAVDVDTITFDTGSWTVDQSQVGRLDRIARSIARILEKSPNEIFLVEGHTDAVGSDVDNLSLSDRRAQSVAAILTRDFRIPAENLVTQGYGETELKEQTSGPSRVNRRVSVRRITPLMGTAGN